jgi:hypothetical protein
MRCADPRSPSRCHGSTRRSVSDRMGYSAQSRAPHNRRYAVLGITPNSSGLGFTSGSGLGWRGPRLKVLGLADRDPASTWKGSLLWSTARQGSAKTPGRPLSTPCRPAGPRTRRTAPLIPAETRAVPDRPAGWPGITWFWDSAIRFLSAARS